jgi:hypothetical protein
MEEKRELLVIELLISKAEVSNIPFNIPIITTHYIDFSLIIAEDVHKAIIEAGNTAPSINKVLIAIL